MCFNMGLNYLAQMYSYIDQRIHECIVVSFLFLAKWKNCDRARSMRFTCMDL